MSDHQDVLRNLQPSKEFFIGIDSDGCAFDTMEIKQKECFCPNLIKSFELQKISKYARETWEFVNLYSKNRGVNRFIALLETMRLLSERPEVKARGMQIPDMSALAEWTKKESRLGNPALSEYEAQANNALISLTYAWSLKVNADIEEMVYGMPPFPFVRESLEELNHKSDALVVSQTPLEALEREWKENQIDHLVRMIAGQEYGTKTEHLALAAKNKYPAHKILMIGDAPGDYKAAKANEVLFFPINPGHEEASWERFNKEGLKRFYAGTYAGDYEKALIAEFDTYLPEQPHWKK
ncbi:MAG: HAD family hydrolase [Bacteroidales bacterium]|nr:HAD family hydrolase [Bacteroidales bacterium]MCB8999073.1 HAD family hydrolase [Bacteroidales bacterium]